MYTALGEEELKSGERLAIGVVECPEPGWAPRVEAFLKHKGNETREHIRRALAAPLDALETRFYVGCVDGEPATGLMIVGSRPVGILGHVFTSPDHRRKGAFSVLMRRQMEDLDRIGMWLLCLSTGFESAPYWIYHSFGFRSIGPGAGQMIWRRDADVERDLFAPAEVAVRALAWADWPWVDLLGMQPVARDEELPRCAAMGLKAQGSLESAFVSLMLRRERHPDVQALALRSGAGSTVGFAVLVPDPRWFGDVWLADSCAHPHFREHERRLLEAMRWDERPCARYRARMPGLENEPVMAEFGFRKRTELPEWFEFAGERHPLEVWVRPGGLHHS